jgi:hypothetical protein
MQMEKRLKQTSTGSFLPFRFKFFKKAYLPIKKKRNIIKIKKTKPSVKAKGKKQKKKG